jgi:hypothetical protein
MLFSGNHTSISVAVFRHFHLKMPADIGVLQKSYSVASTMDQQQIAALINQARITIALQRAFASSRSNLTLRISTLKLRKNASISCKVLGT